MSTTPLFDELAWRGLVNQTTFDNPEAINEPRTFYFGADPSSDSMQIGNLAGVVLVKRLVDAGHKAILLVGGATGMVGDPKDDAERDLKPLEEIARNKAGIAAQYRQILGGEQFEMVDNYDWFKDIGYLQFLRDVGKHFSLSQLLDRDFVKSRLGEGGAGISYAEFSYSLIQGYDYLHLYREKGATLQIGGSDQWGNMLSGTQLIRQLESAEAHVWTIPLVINKATGKKFGKSEGGAIWLDEKKTSPYRFYQFWLNVDDEGAPDYAKIYTFLNREEIESLIKQQAENPGSRPLQKALAYEVTKLVHGQERTESVQRVTEVLFGGADFSTLSGADLDELAAEIPTVQLGGTVVSALVDAGAAGSNGEALRLIKGGGVSVKGAKLAEDQEITQPALIRKGKNTFVLVR